MQIITSLNPPKTHQQLVNLQIFAKPSRNRKVLLPAGFHFPKMAVKSHLSGTSAESWDVVQLEDSQVLECPPIEPGPYKVTDTGLYKLSNENECNKKEHNARIATDISRHLSLDLEKIFEIFEEEAHTYGDTYNQHIRPVFKEYMGEEKHSSNWFRFSGSSVWLKDFNIHFVVSRLMITENGNRVNPRLSMLLAQVFDEQWNEIEDVRLVFPSNNGEGASRFRVNGQDFTSYRFPRILPVPFVLGGSGFYWGAEDPRMTLVRNKNGHDEPLVVFNAFQTKEVVEEDGKTQIKGFRSIFMCFPFQVQKGKQLLEGNRETTDDHYFTHTKQVIIDGEPERVVEKNWTPFVSSGGEYTKHVMFATSFEPFKVIKCDLWTDSPTCQVEESQNGDVGQLRGGTPLVSIKRVDAEDKEFFAGLARSHLTHCGCGIHFYRPNLVVVARIGTTWSLAQVSSSVDLGMDLIPWDDEERVNVHGVLKALNDSRYWEFAVGENTVSPIKCAQERSNEFCKAYAAKVQKRSSFGEFVGAIKRWVGVISWG
ncbi:hypothetical protein JCM33374_g296 [Metschnikowia sp. JCM 33374]|nr:hypothetical protein JCM33374_g296 [Metschnikowia sp. JCM 33374]